MPEEVIDSEPAPAWSFSEWTSDVETTIREEVGEWFGTPYQMGGTDKSGVDCSAFMMTLYRELFNVDLPRTTSEQATVGDEVAQEELQPGDLIFFRPRRGRHVGIYLSNGEFAHASASQGVMISKLDQPYWERAYWTARRIFEEAPVEIEISALGSGFAPDTLNASRSGW